MKWIDLDRSDVGRIWDDALRILHEIGLQVTNENIAPMVAQELEVKGNRIHFPETVALRYADEIRERFGSEPSDPPERISIFSSSLNTHWLDPADGCVKPHDTQTVIRHTRLIRQLAGEGLSGGRAAGVPQDVPAEMQFLITHYIDCVYSRRPGGWGIIQSEAMMHYFLEMAEVMELPKSIGTEMISPLRFMGQSIDLALDYHDRGMTVGIDPMPILGVTAPADWHMAWAQSVAENVGSYALFRACGIRELGCPSFRLFLSNPAAAMTYFSAPQHIAALLTRRRVRQFFGLSTLSAELMLVTSKVPDSQAAMEKMAGCLLGRLFDFPYLEGAGGLWLDEIFSPQQLLIDVEIKHFVEGIKADFADFNETPQDIISVMEEGVRAGGFLAHDLSLDRFREFAWESRLFDLRPRAAWDGTPQSLLAKAARIAEEKIDAYEYELTGDRRRALDEIVARAKREFDGTA